MEENRQSSNRLWLIGILSSIGLTVWAFLGWTGTELMFHATDGAEFCGNCHVMSPMVDSYLEDVHGGKNVSGFRAICLQCHLPHNSPLDYGLAKARTGLHDLWAQWTYDLEKIDWVSKRERREEYTYDSGCLSCHQNLERSTMASNKAFVAHRPYFQKTTQKTCVTCHAHVGHFELLHSLREHQGVAQF